MLGQNQRRRKVPLFIFLLFISFTLQQFSIPTPVTPLRPYMVMVIMVTILFVFQFLSNKTFRVIFTFQDYSLIALYGYMMMTSLYAEDKKLSLQMVFGIILLLLSYFIVRVSCFKYTLSTLLGALFTTAKYFFILSFVWYLIGMIFYYVIGVPLELEGDTGNRAVLFGVYFEGGLIPRFRGVCDSPNNFGMYAVFLLPLLITYTRQFKFRQLCFVFIMIILTLSITSFVAFFCMIMFLFIIKFNELDGIFFKSIGIYLIMLFFVVLVCFFIYFYILSSDLNFANLKDLLIARIDRVSSGSGRFELWRYTWSLISERPLFGYGLNQARVLLEPFRELNSTHNNFLEITLEGGFIGLILYLSFIISIIRGLRSKMIRSRERIWMAMVLLGSFIFSNANVTLYADSLILTLAVFSTISTLAGKHLDAEFKMILTNSPI